MMIVNIYRSAVLSIVFVAFGIIGGRLLIEAVFTRRLRRTAAVFGVITCLIAFGLIAHALNK